MNVRSFSYFSPCWDKIPNTQDFLVCFVLFPDGSYHIVHLFKSHLLKKISRQVLAMSGSGSSLTHYVAEAGPELVAVFLPRPPYLSAGIQVCVPSQLDKSHFWKSGTCSCFYQSVTHQAPRTFHSLLYPLLLPFLPARWLAPLGQKLGWSCSASGHSIVTHISKFWEFKH